MFEFYMGTKIYYGQGSRIALPAILKDNGWSKIAVVVDHNIVDVDIIEELLASLNKNCDRVIVGQCTISEPTYAFLDEIRKQFEHEKVEAVVGIGGGSALDAAKAVAVLINNRKPALEYRGFNKMTGPVHPIIAMPTTAGTGSEVTPNASFIDSHEKRKMGINGEAVRPKYAILDPWLTLSCPEKPTISAGIDSLVHAVEAFAAKKSNTMAKLFASEGFRHVFLNLPLVVAEPKNIEYRERVMYGAFLAGVALMNSGTGPAAAMSYPLGVHFGIPHGVGGGIFLPFVVQHNVQNGYYDYAGLYDALGVDTTAKTVLSDDYKSQAFIESLFAVWRTLAIPDNLSQLGVNASFRNQFIKETLDLKGALDQNPVPFFENEIKSILSALHL